MTRRHLAEEENALKAKLRRLCGAKANGEIGVPEWLHKQWKNGDHMSMALEYQRCGFDKDLCSGVKTTVNIYTIQWMMV